MAAIQKRGKKYRARVIRKGFPSLSKTFNSHAEALRWSREAESCIDRGEIKPNLTNPKEALGRDLNPLFQDAAEHYIKTHSIHKKIVRSETYRLKILIKRWGGLRVGQIDKFAIMELRDDLLKLGRSGDTINHYFNTLSKLFQMLSGDWDLQIANPIKGIKRMPPSQGRTKRISEKMEWQLFAACNRLSTPLLSSIIEFAMQTGMRRGELMGLAWTDIDLPNRRAFLHTSKNGEPRQVPLTRRAKSVLENLQKNNGVKVFPMSLNVLRNQFERVVELLKNEWSETESNPYIDLRFHDLRHEALSRLSDAGLNVIELSHISGHKTLAMLKRYTHPSHEAIFAKLDKSLSS